MPQFLKPANVARMLDFDRSTVCRWIEEGKVFDPKKIIYINDKPRIPTSEVRRVLADGNIENHQ